MEFNVSQEKFEEILRDELKKEVRIRVERDADEKRYYCVAHDKLNSMVINEAMRSMLIEMYGEHLNKHIKKILSSDSFQKAVVDFVATKLKDTFYD